MPGYTSFQTYFKAHDIPGLCGKCGKNFPYKANTEFFCSPCRSLEPMAWKHWMDMKNTEAQKCKRSH